MRDQLGTRHADSVISAGNGGKARSEQDPLELVCPAGDVHLQLCRSFLVLFAVCFRSLAVGTEKRIRKDRQELRLRV